MKKLNLSKKPKDILLVTSDEHIATELCKLLQKSGGFSCVQVDSIDEAEIEIDRSQFFAAIVDYGVGNISIDSKVFTNVPSVLFSDDLNEIYKQDLSKSYVIDYFEKNSIGFLENIAKIIRNLDFIYGRKALIVDDSESARSFISDAFSHLMFETVQASDAMEAIDKLTNDEDIVIVTIDYAMPEHNGVDLAQMIQTQFASRDVVLFGISAHDTDEVKHKFIKNGISSFIRKPFGFEEFSAKIFNHMRLLQQKRRLDEYIDIISRHVIVSITDTNGRIKYASDAFCDISGYSKDELIGKNHNLTRHPDMPAELFAEMWNTIKSGKSWSGEIKNRKKDGGFYWVKANIEPIFDIDSTILGYQSIRTDITDKKTLELISITDSMTKLYNRRFFDLIFEQVIKKQKYAGSTMAFMMLDIDNFKKYNDTYGHQMGDHVIATVGQLMLETISSENAHPIRLGGEEFAGVLIGYTKAESIDVTNKIKNKIQEQNIEHKNNDDKGVVTASFGLVFLDFSIETYKNMTAKEIYLKTDKALYVAKENGRNRLVFWPE